MNRVYGPYTRKDGRQHVIVVHEDKTKHTISYPKYLMECKLGRSLDPNLETVHHKDEDFTNNDLDNLYIISRSEHTKLHSKPAEKYIFICPNCLGEFEGSASRIRHNLKQGKSGPYCSKHCAGQYTRF